MREEDFQCVFLDYLLPDGTGLDFVEEVRKFNQITPVIIVTSQKDDKIVIEAMRKGASDYITKSLYTSEGLRLALQNALKTFDLEKLKEENTVEVQRNVEQLNEAQRMPQTGY